MPKLADRALILETGTRKRRVRPSHRGWTAASVVEANIELAGLLAGGSYEGPTRSPDRADACVWAMSELASKRASVPRVRML